MSVDRLDIDSSDFEVNGSPFPPFSRPLSPAITIGHGQCQMATILGSHIISHNMLIVFIHLGIVALPLRPLVHHRA